MTTYTDRQKACIQAVQDGLMELSSVYVSVTDDEAAQFLAYLESTSPITGFSEPDGGAGDVKERALLAAGQWANADTPISEALAYRDGFVAGSAHSQPAAPAVDRRHVGDSKFEGWYADYCAKGYTNTKQVARDAYAAGMGDDTPQPAAPSTAAQGATLTDDPRADLGNRMKLAREAGLMLRIDGKFGSDHYHSVTGSWPALIRFAVSLAAPTPVADSGASEPIPMLLFCPNCGEQHIDKPEEREYDEGLSTRMSVDWTNPPHRSHLCHSCECIWRPADVPTTGVAAISTKGKADTWDAAKPVSDSDAIDIAKFAELIDDYQCAQKDGAHDERAKARIALINAYRAAAKPVSAEQVDSMHFVQPVPEHCDRIVWRGSYYHLPIKPVSVDAGGVTALRNLRDVLRMRHHGRMPEEVQRAYEEANRVLDGQPTDAPMTERSVVDAVRQWFPDRAYQAPFFARALLGISEPESTGEPQ